jgi:hypothetical protein
MNLFFLFFFFPIHAQRSRHIPSRVNAAFLFPFFFLFLFFFFFRVSYPVPSSIIACRGIVKQKSAAVALAIVAPPAQAAKGAVSH